MEMTGLGDAAMSWLEMPLWHPPACHLHDCPVLASSNAVRDRVSTPITLELENQAPR